MHNRHTVQYNKIKYKVKNAYGAALILQSAIKKIESDDRS